MTREKLLEIRLFCELNISNDLLAINSRMIFELCEMVLGMQEVLDKISSPHPNPGYLSDLELISYLQNIAEEALEKFGLKEEK